MKNMLSTIWTSPSGLRLLVAVHTKIEPTDAEWEGYLSCSKQMFESSLDNIQGLTFADGAAPNVKQRGRLNQAFPPGAKKPHGAIISDSTFVRGVVTALSWINPNIRSFSPKNAHNGFAYLQLKPEDQAALMAYLRALSAELPECKTLAAVLAQRATA